MGSITRRDSLLLGAYAASRIATAQDRAGDLAVTNSTGVRIVPYGDGTTPAIRLSLPGRSNEAAAVIEMPEHAYRKTSNTAEPVWFYRMYTNDARLKGRPLWTRENNALAYRMTLPSGWAMNAKATLDSGGVEIAYQIVNPENAAFAETQAPTCIKLYQPFTDVFPERTWVHHAEGLDLLASETPQRLAKNAEEWLPCRYIVRCSSTAAPPEKRVERQAEGITLYRKLRAADTAFLATESSPKGWVAATHSLDSPDVWSNPARTCHHADSGAPLGANGSARLSLKLYLVRGSVKDAWSKVVRASKRGEL